MALTKTQIRYLEDKLERIVNEKIEDFRKSLGERKSTEKRILDALQNGSIKLLSSEQIIKAFVNQRDNSRYYSAVSMQIDDLISKKDRDKITNEFNKEEEVLQNYIRKLVEVKRNALDKIVLEGLNVEDAIKKIEEVK